MSFKLGFKVHGLDKSTAAFAAFKIGLIERISKMLVDMGEEVTGTTREDYLSGQALKRRTGQLASRTTFRVVGNEVSIGNNLAYGGIWEYGGTIPAHEIRPRNARALVFQMGKRTVFATLVRQKARKVEPRPYLAPALSDSMTRIREIAQFWANDAMEAAFPGGTA